MYLYEELYDLARKLNAKMYYDAWEYKGKRVLVDDAYMDVLRMRLGGIERSEVQI